MVGKARRRLSSDGFKLFNLAYTHPPSPSKIKKLLSCLFHSEYDDRLEKMVSECREASCQAYMMCNDKSLNINKLLNNAIFNLIYSILCKDDKLGNKHSIKQNYRYFFDVMHRSYDEEDHNTALLLKSALEHSCLRVFKFKERKKDKEVVDILTKRYGTWRNCYRLHLTEAMNKSVTEEYLPSLMVLQMHVDRHAAYEKLNRVKLTYYPDHIRSQIGLYSTIYPLIPYTRYPLFEDPPVTSNTDLHMIVNTLVK